MGVRKFAIAGAALCALAMAGCSTLSTVADNSTVTEHKALLAAVASVDGASIALTTAASSGKLTGANAAKAQADLHAAQGYLLDAKAAETALDQTTLTAKIAAIAALVGTIMQEAGY